MELRLIIIAESGKNQKGFKEKVILKQVLWEYT